MSEPNQVLWRGIRPTDPQEYIPVSFFKSNEVQYSINGDIDGDTLTLLTVPVGHTYHIINMFGNIDPRADGKGHILIRDGSGTVKTIFQLVFSDTYRILLPNIVLLAPIALFENELIEIKSDTINFRVYCSVIYTKE